MLMRVVGAMVLPLLLISCAKFDSGAKVSSPAELKQMNDEAQKKLTRKTLTAVAGRKFDRIVEMSETPPESKDKKAVFTAALLFENVDGHDIYSFESKVNDASVISKGLVEISGDSSTLEEVSLAQLGTASFLKKVTSGAPADGDVDCILLSIRDLPTTKIFTEAKLNTMMLCR